MNTQRSSLPRYVEERARRINIKSKRKKNLFKKAIELRRLCDLDMLIVIRDKEYNKIQVYNSSPSTFCQSKVKKLLW